MKTSFSVVLLLKGSRGMDPSPLPEHTPDTHYTIHRCGGAHVHIARQTVDILTIVVYSLRSANIQLYSVLCDVLCSA